MTRRRTTTRGLRNDGGQGRYSPRAVLAHLGDVRLGLAHEATEAEALALCTNAVLAGNKEWAAARKRAGKPAAISADDVASTTRFIRALRAERLSNDPEYLGEGLVHEPTMWQAAMFESCRQIEDARGRDGAEVALHQLTFMFDHSGDRSGEAMGKLRRCAAKFYAATGSSPASTPREEGNAGVAGDGDGGAK